MQDHVPGSQVPIIVLRPQFVEFRFLVERCWKEGMSVAWRELAVARWDGMGWVCLEPEPWTFRWLAGFIGRCSVFLALLSTGTQDVETARALIAAGEDLAQSRPQPNSRTVLYRLSFLIPFAVWSVLKLVGGQLATRMTRLDADNFNAALHWAVEPPAWSILKVPCVPDCAAIDLNQSLFSKSWGMEWNPWTGATPDIPVVAIIACALEKGAWRCHMGPYPACYAWYWQSSRVV